jgi:hypothetical protein
MKDKKQLREYMRDYRTKPGQREKNRARARTAVRAARGAPLPTRPEPAHCECCGNPPNGSGLLHLDHCHETGEFRGWLCLSCNAGIGQLGDSALGLIRALDYLIKCDPTFRRTT